MPKAIVVLSGGQDSTTCLFSILEAGYKVHAVTFDYNQRHKLEIEAAKNVIQIAKEEYPGAILSHEIITLGPILKGSSPLVSNEALEQYANHQSLPGGIEKTFVPMRNQLFLTIAMNRAFVEDAKVVVTGVCEEDYGGYPDCRRAFIDELEVASNLGTHGEPDTKVRIVTPLMKLTKKETVELAIRTRGCYRALAYTHTSYDGAYPPTGKDHATLLRAKGFEEADVPDPLILRAYKEGLMDLPESKNYHYSQGALDEWMAYAEV